MALRSIAPRISPVSFTAFAAFASKASSSVLSRVVSLTIVDQEGIRHPLKGLVGDYLNEILAENDELRDLSMVAVPHGLGSLDTHVFVTKETMKLLSPVSGKEADNLKSAAKNQTPNSRMASAIQLTKSLDGVVIGLGDTRPWMTR